MALVPLYWRVAIGDATALQPHMEVGMVQLTELHVTLFYLGGKHIPAAAAALDISSDDATQMCETLESMKGREVDVIVTAVLKHPSMSVAAVTLPDDIPCATGKPHVTLCHGADVKPVFAQELMSDRSKYTRMEISPPLHLRGIVGLVVSSVEERRALAPTGPSQFRGGFLGVETCERAGVSVEPTGLGTFHTWNEQSQELAARLVASVKEKGRGLGNPEYRLKVNLQKADRPGHLYIKWAAACGDLEAKEIGALLEERLRVLAPELVPEPAAAPGGFADGADGSSADKKIKALKKKLRDIAKLKDKRADELDELQREKLAGEVALIQQIRDLGGEL